MLEEDIVKIYCVSAIIDNLSEAAEWIDDNKASVKRFDFALGVVFIIIVTLQWRYQFVPKHGILPHKCKIKRTYFCRSWKISYIVITKHSCVFSIFISFIILYFFCFFALCLFLLTIQKVFNFFQHEAQIEKGFLFWSNIWFLCIISSYPFTWYYNEIVSFETG